MDSSNQNSHPQITNQSSNSLQFTILLPHQSSNPDSTNPTQNPNSNPNLTENPNSNAPFVHDQVNSASAPKKRRRGKPRPPSVHASSSFVNAGVSGSASSSSSGRVSSQASNKTGSNSDSSQLARRNAHAMMDEIIVINKEATAEALIALTAGFPADSLTEEEIDYGVVSDVDGIEQVNYILIRNHIITRWRENVSRWVTKEMFVNIVPKHCGALLESAYRYLVAYGYINFGVAPAIKERIFVDSSKPNIIIVGAGLAGLAAARQLMAFGFKVVVLEGRKRAGGRVYTKKLEAMGGKKVGFVDLGGSVLTGTLGNPLGILARQLSLTLHKVRDKCPLYSTDGMPVDPDMDKKVEDDFNQLLDTVSKHRQMMGEVSQDVSLGAALETFRGTLSEEEMNLFNWHIANLEYANAGLVSRLSLAFWDQDDPYDMGGDHCFVPGGNGRLIQALVENVPIHYGKKVDTIRYDNDGVQVSAGEQVYKGDMVLCTVPLGVLKNGSIDFIPQLPQRKLDGIKRLGFGLLNKVILLFSHAFWGTDLDTFGHLSDDPNCRGEFFLFYSYATVAGGAVLIGLVAGEAAHRFEIMEPVVAVARVLRVLRGIYEPQGIEVPEPLQSVCTRWASDPFCCGSYSNVAVGASGDDYDILAESVGDGRLFFAGEATTRRYPATMHGALLSGFREAANMAHYAKIRSSGLKIEKNLSENAHACASILADLFRAPEVEFGCFALIFGRKHSDSMAILRVTFGGQRKKQDQQHTNKLLFEQLQSHFNQQLDLHVYALLSKQQALELREVRGGDEAKLNHLSEKFGIKLVGRKGLGPAADSVIASIKAERIRGRRMAKSSGKSMSKAAPVKQHLIRRAKIMGNSSRSSIQSPQVGNKMLTSNANIESRPLVNSNGSNFPSSDLGVRAISSNGDVAPLNSHIDADFITDITGLIPQSLDLSNSVQTHIGSNIVSTLSSTSMVALNSNDGLRLEGEVADFNPQNFALGNSLSLPSLNTELTGDIRDNNTNNFDSINSLVDPPSSEVGTSELSSQSSLAPSNLHVSSLNSQNYAGDISDNINNMSIQENIFDDIMNEPLPSAGTHSDTWPFTRKL